MEESKRNSFSVCVIFLTLNIHYSISPRDDYFSFCPIRLCIEKKMHWIHLWCCDPSIKSWGQSERKSKLFPGNYFRVINLRTKQHSVWAYYKPDVSSCTRKGASSGLPQSEELRCSGGDEAQMLSSHFFFNSALIQTSSQPMAWQDLSALKHIDVTT